MVAGSSGAGMALVTEGYRNLIGRDVRFRPLDPEPKAMAIWAWWRRGDVATWRCQPRDVSPAMSAPRCQPRDVSPAISACIEAIENETTV